MPHARSAGDNHRVFAVVLAAGGSSRFGTTKQLEAIDGVSLVARAARLARSVCGDSTILVTGHDSTAVAGAAGEAARFVIVNDHYAEGMSSSIAAAANALAQSAVGILLILADQPLITADHLQEMLNNWSGSETEIVATRFAGTSGPPVYFPSGTFPALARLTGDQGARSVLQDKQFTLKTIQFEDAVVDIDTPHDLADFAKKYSSGCGVFLDGSKAQRSEP